MKFGDRTVDFLCFDKEESQHVSREILIGRTYPPVPFAKDVQVIVDIGANLGAASVYFSLLYPNATIYSVEPQKEPFEILVRNTSSNPNNKVFNFGLFNATQESTIHHSWADSSTASIGKSWLNTQETERINLKDAGEWIQEQNIEKIDVLKIDTEGCEVPILSRLTTLIPKTQVIYIEYHSESDRRSIDTLIGESHVLFQARAECAHKGELIYVRADLGDESSDLHKHQIRMPR
jgi:FkbM family methyltransferase